MQAIVCASQLDELHLLEFALKSTGLALQGRRSLEQIVESWTEQPADFLLIALEGNVSKQLGAIQALRAIAFAPIVIILDPQPEETLLQLYLAGADLVLTRPVSLRLLPHQVRPLLARSNSMPLHGLPDLVQPSVRLDPQTRTVAVRNHPPVHLTQLEFRLMYSLMIHSGQILSAEEIVSLVWGYTGDENRELVPRPGPALAFQGGT